jgi:RND superfamily putative drug exporter
MARLPAGRWSKWLVVGFWLVVFGVAGPLAGKLNSAQQNDASSWLPHNAESTQVVELAKRFAPADIFPALVVYERPDGPITPADQAKAAADARRFATIQDVTGKVIGPVPASDGRALQVVCRSGWPRRATAGRSSPHGSRRCGPSPRPTPAGSGCM